MTTTNAPAVIPQNEVATLEQYANGLKTKLDMAATLLKSGLIPKSFTSPEGVLTAILYGQELGLSPMQSLMGINVIQGRPSVDAATIKAKVLMAGGRIETVTWTDKVCTLVGVRGDWKEEVTYSIEDAKVAGYSSKENWQKQPKAMLYARCVSIIGRNMFADVIKGFYSTEELRDAMPPAEPVRSTAAERREERAKQIKERDQYLASFNAPRSRDDEYEEEEAKHPAIEPQQSPAEPIIYRFENPTAEQRVYLEKHCEYDEQYKVWLSKKDLGEKLAKYKITTADLMDQQ